MTGPLVTCLMPTAGRRPHVPHAIESFLAQDHGPRELVIVDDGHDAVADLVPHDERIRYVRVAAGRSLGAKRNLGCQLARGEIIVHWDDDDWSVPWRLSYQLQALAGQAADICGLDRLWFFDAQRELAWHYRYPRARTPWLAGSSLCFRRSVWLRHRFPDVTIGEDTGWVAGAIGTRVLVHERDDFLVARVHRGNTASKQPVAPWWRSVDPQRVRAIVGPGAGLAWLAA